MRSSTRLTLVAATAALACSAAAMAAAPAAGTGTPESRATVLAAGIAHLTGLAISPLLVLVAIGWTDFASAGGAPLPMHANLWILVPCTTVLAMVLMKKLATPAIPLPIRKLLDAAEYLEAKLSALVAAGLLLPTIVSSVAAATGGSGAAAQAAGISADWAGYTLIALVAVVLFGAVWLTFHMVDALIVLSPFALLDMALASARLAVLALVGLALLVSPFVALALCLPIIVLSLMFAGWCIRLDLFALTFATDILFGRAATTDPDAPVRSFLASRGLGAPIRTMGHATPADGTVRFTYRPFFVFPRRTIALPASRCTIVRGAVWPTIHAGEPRRRLLSLPPRYTRHSERIAARFDARAEDGALIRAWKGMRGSLAASLGGDAAEHAGVQ
jgi:hypothetical protein